ncbi:MAG: glycyl-radical enzyme activating protein [Bacteroides sp.]
MTNHSLIFDIKHYSINDGPGIRTTLFLKGCPLSCIWCHNPEGVSAGKQKMYASNKCIHCSCCVNACPENALTLTADGIHCDETRCLLCGKCTEACPAKAMEMSGKFYSYDSLMEEIKKEIPFFDQSGGGVTFCGGEPLLHRSFLLEMLARCKQIGVHCTVDTCLYASPAVAMDIATKADLLLIDLKQMNSELHQKYTGVPNELILSNLRMVAEAGIDFFIRIPLIEGVNADEENLRRSAEFLASLPWERRHIHLLPYHDIARNKHAKLHSDYNREGIAMSEPSQEGQQRAIALFAEYGLLATIGG